jgi:tetratricopeptide (TPR) repeat protein
MADESDPVAAAQVAFAERINAGRQHANADALDEARAAFVEAIRIFPLHPQGYLERGSIRSLQGDTPGAVDDLGVALALSEPDEDVLQAHFNRGNALLDVRQAGRAVLHFEATAAAGVEGAQRLLTRARREAAQEGFVGRKAAEASCARGFELLSHAPLVALACFEDARRFAPDLLWAVHGAGQANGAIRRPHHARNDFTYVLEHGASGAMRAEALYNRAALLPKDADSDAKQQAREDFEECLAIAEDPDVPFPAVGDPVQAEAIIDAIRARLDNASGDVSV